MDCSLPGSYLHGILQARVLEWAATSFSRGSSRLRDQTPVSCIAGRRFNLWATREAKDVVNLRFNSTLAMPLRCKLTLKKKKKKAVVAISLESHTLSNTHFRFSRLTGHAGLCTVFTLSCTNRVSNDASSSSLSSNRWLLGPLYLLRLQVLGHSLLSHSQLL